MPDEGWPESLALPIREQSSTTNPTTTLVAGQALSERMRGRAELYRVINGTNSRNDYDLDARTIDALIALAASKHIGVAVPQAGRERRRVAGGRGGD
jgi:hypothetical protein